MRERPAESRATSGRQRASLAVAVNAAIITLALYGDLLKLFIAPTVALWVLYGAAAGILVALAAMRDRTIRIVPVPGATAIVGACAALIGLYAAQVLTSFNAPLANGIVHATYVSIPLAYVIVVQRFSTTFDLRRLAGLFLWMMIPVNVVGWIQYFVDPTFLVSTTYSESGGVILRNLLATGLKFQRFPSIFASADRYSAMGLMHLYFTVLVLGEGLSLGWRRTLWVLCNLAASGSALLIAGARSRILIAILVLTVAIASLGIEAFRSIGRTGLRFARKVALFLAVGGAAMGVALVVIPNDVLDHAAGFPVIGFLAESFRQGDVEDRVQQAAEISALPDDISMFGEGLGTQGDGGKPGEFGIAAIWRESGLVWGLGLIAAFLTIILVLTIKTYRAITGGRVLDSVRHAFPMLLVAFALTAGLTSAFELSSGVLLGCIIGSGTRALDRAGTRRGAESTRVTNHGSAIAV